MPVTHIEWIEGASNPSPEPGAYLGFFADSIRMYRFTGEVWQGSDEDCFRWETWDAPAWYAKIDAVPPDYTLQTREERFGFKLRTGK